jgi:hypothetical protein
MAKSIDSPDRLNPTALSLEDAAMILAKLGGGRITAEMLEADVESGAPLNADGTLNIVHYAAWLLKETSGGR